MPRVFLLIAALLMCAACTALPTKSVRVDPQIAAEIAKIRWVDNHAHPVRPTLDGELADMEYDALPVENLEPQSDQLLLRPNAPDIVDAHKRMFGGKKSDAMKKYGRDYAVHVLDELNIETMLANRVALGPGLPSTRFLWVPFAD